MKLRFFKPSSLGISAMVVAMCGYAGAQMAPQNAEQSAPPATQQQASAQNLKLVSADAQLTHDLNAKNATPGQTVTAKLTSSVKAANGMKLEKGTVLTGRVSQVQKSTDHGPSQISIVINEARLKDGHTIPVKATLLGAYPVVAGYNTNQAFLAEQPHFISSTQKVVQQPGQMGNITMQSAVQSPVSATFTNKNGNVNLKQGTRLQIAIAPMTRMGAEG